MKKERTVPRNVLMSSGSWDSFRAYLRLCGAVVADVSPAAGISTRLVSEFTRRTLPPSSEQLVPLCSPSDGCQSGLPETFFVPGDHRACSPSAVSGVSESTEISGLISVRLLFLAEISSSPSLELLLLLLPPPPPRLIVRCGGDKCRKDITNELHEAGSSSASEDEVMS